MTLLQALAAKVSTQAYVKYEIMKFTDPLAHMAS
jgi:hypothetical protein